jgi:hypothetical protein
MISLSEAKRVFSTVVDADLAARRKEWDRRLAAAKQSLAEGHREAAERRAAFWRAVEAQRAIDAEWRRVQAKGAEA